MPDEGHIRLFGDDHRYPGHHRRHWAVEALMWEAAAVLRRGGDVILDVGFWSRRERDQVRAWAARLEAVVVHYSPVPHGQLACRARARKAAWDVASGAGEFAFPETNLAG